LQQREQEFRQRKPQSLPASNLAQLGKQAASKLVTLGKSPEYKRRRLMSLLALVISLQRSEQGFRRQKLENLPAFNLVWLRKQAEYRQRKLQNLPEFSRRKLKSTPAQGIRLRQSEREFRRHELQNLLASKLHRPGKQAEYSLDRLGSTPAFRRRRLMRTCGSANSCLRVLACLLIWLHRLQLWVGKAELLTLKQHN
jgi:hypothetical protein